MERAMSVCTPIRPLRPQHRKRRAMKKLGLVSTVVFLFAILTAIPGLAGDYVLFSHNDALRSPVVLTDRPGNVMSQVDYAPFGEQASLSGTLATTHHFIGQVRDAHTSLHYLRARV